MSSLFCKQSALTFESGGSKLEQSGSWLTNNVAKRQHAAITRLSLLLALKNKNAMTLSGPTLLGNTRSTLFAILKSDYYRCGKAKGQIVGGCWTMLYRRLTDWLYYCNYNGIKLMMRLYSFRFYYKNCLHLTRDKFDLIS